MASNFALGLPLDLKIAGAWNGIEIDVSCVRNQAWGTP